MNLFFRRFTHLAATSLQASPKALGPDHPDVATSMKAAYDQYWKEARPLMVNETAPMSPTKPYHEWYREQAAAGGIPTWVAPEI